MELIKATLKDLQELYNGSALTFEGVTLDEDNLNYLKTWLKEHDASLRKDEAYIVSGKLMNDTFNLTGDRKYPDNLNILSIKLDNIENYQNIIIARFELGGRWMDDIICGNIDGDWNF